MSLFPEDAPYRVLARKYRPAAFDALIGQEAVVTTLANAIARNRELMGATDPRKADKGTIRADFADSIDANAVHGSDGPDTAAAEIAFFFPGLDIHAR